MPDINGIPYVESTDLVSAYPAASQALAQEISDQLALKLDASVITSGAWTSYTPVLTASTTNPTLGTGSTQEGAYAEFGKLIVFRVYIQFGTASVNAGSGFYSVSLPVTAAANRLSAHALLIDNSTGNRRNYGCVISATNVVSMQGGDIVVQATSPWTFAASDQIYITGSYEAA